MCLRVSLKKKIWKKFATLKSQKKGAGSGSAQKMSRIPNTAYRHLFSRISTFLFSLGSTLGPEENLDIFPKSTKVRKVTNFTQFLFLFWPSLWVLFDAQEVVSVQTLLCSAKLTQNLDLMALLKWRSHPERRLFQMFPPLITGFIARLLAFLVVVNTCSKTARGNRAIF